MMPIPNWLKIGTHYINLIDSWHILIETLKKKTYRSCLQNAPIHRASYDLAPYQDCVD